MTVLRYLQAYPPHLQEQVRQLIAKDRLGAYLEQRYAERHAVKNDKALYAYAQEDADHWAEQLGHEIPPGVFGENLRTVGIDVNDARIGEIWRIGTEVEVQVTSPRTPCGTFARRLAGLLDGVEERGWVRRFSDERRLGPYLRVLTNGRIRSGDEITVLERPDGPSVVDVYRAPRAAAAPRATVGRAPVPAG